MAKTLYEKLFDAHVVYEAENETPLLYIDRHLVKWRVSRCRN